MIYSKYARNKLIDAALRGGTIAFPSTYYVALLVDKPTAQDVYQEIGSVNPNGYARVSIVASAANWSATNAIGSTTATSTGTLTRSSNNNSITFPNPSGGNWVHGVGTGPSKIKYIGLFDSATIGAGNLWMYAPLGGQKEVLSTDFNISIAPNGLGFTFDK
jgi:hypothetical protein